MYARTILFDIGQGFSYLLSRAIRSEDRAWLRSCVFQLYVTTNPPVLLFYPLLSGPFSRCRVRSYQFLPRIVLDTQSVHLLSLLV